MALIALVLWENSVIEPKQIRHALVFYFSL